MESKTEINAAKCTRVPIKQLTSVEKKDLVQIFRDHWWTVDDEDNALFFKGYSPQCNANEALAKSLCERVYPDFKVIHVPVAFIPVRSNDFDYDV